MNRMRKEQRWKERGGQEEGKLEKCLKGRQGKTKEERKQERRKREKGKKGRSKSKNENEV